jgi:hypothetical protein
LLAHHTHFNPRPLKRLRVAMGTVRLAGLAGRMPRKSSESKSARLQGPLRAMVTFWHVARQLLV